MNTIKKPRKRPRVDSINFHSFYWAVRLEAAFMVTRRNAELEHFQEFRRERVVLDRTGILVARALKLVRLTPALRRLDGWITPA